MGIDQLAVDQVAMHKWILIAVAIEAAMLKDIIWKRSIVQ